MWGEQVYFLHEFCSLSKSLQMVQQLRLFRYVTFEWSTEIGVFSVCLLKNEFGLAY